MKKDTGPRTGELSWVQPKLRHQEYRLEKEGKPVASLRWTKASGSLATGEAGGSRWTFKRVGYFRPRMTVRVEGSIADLAVFTPRWTSKGVLRFSDGRSYRWTRVSVWNWAWAFSSEDGTPLVRFRQRTSARKWGTVRIEDAARSSADLPILLILGWYLLVLMDREADAAAAPAVSGPTM